MYSIEVKKALTDKDYTEWDDLWKKSSNPKVITLFIGLKPVVHCSRENI